MYKLRVVLTERSLTGLLATFLPKWKFSEYDPQCMRQLRKAFCVPQMDRKRSCERPKMKSPQEVSAFPNGEPESFKTSSIDRRQFVGYAAGLGAWIGLGGSVFAQGQAADAEKRLPDGTEQVSWEQPLTFSRTYCVDNGSARADDNGPGSSDRPFRTIGKAAEVLQPGERVVIASGTYREWVRPARGGDGPGKMISYEAAPGAKVSIKGSEVLKEGWTQDPVNVFRRPGAPSGTPAPPPPALTWGYTFTGAMFPDAYNPFALASVAGDRAWLDTKVSDMGPYFRRRGLVFADGKPLEPVEVQRELGSPKLFRPPAPGTPQPPNGLPPRARGGPIMQEIGGTEDGRFWPDANGQSVHVRLPSGTPAEHLIEVTTREQVFAPVNRGLGYIRVKGLTLQHAGNGYPLPQRGAMLDVMGGHHWILEDNTIEWANGIGVEIGVSGGGAQQPPEGHIVRRNTIRYCGIEGIAGIGTRDVLVEDNLFEWCGWADAEREWESAAVKFHGAQNMLLRRNVIRYIRHANAVWFDSGNVNCRITGNVFADVVTVSAAVHMEVNLQQNQIDNNIIWDVRNAEPGTPGQRGCAGSGVFVNASDKVTINQNLIGRCDNSGIFMIIRPDRAGTGGASGNKVYNNIFTKCDRSAIVFLNPDNESDGNLFADMPYQFLGFFTGDSKQFMTLAAWRETHSWDKNSAVVEMHIDLDPDRLELTILCKEPIPRFSTFNHIEGDMFGKGSGERRFPGPLANPAAKSVWKVDPRTGIA